VTFSWMNQARWVHEVACKIKMIGLGVNQHTAGHQIDLGNTKALLERNGYREALANPQRCGSQIDTNQGVHLGGSERCASAI
jgi:hypothetical protein